MTRLVWTIPDGDSTARWATDDGGGSQSVSDPVVIAFDDPDLGAGVDLPYPAGAYPLAVLLDVTESFDDGEFEVTNQDGNIVTAAQYDYQQQEFTAVGIRSWAVDTGQGGSDEIVTSILLRLQSGSPTTGSVTARIVYAGPFA